MKNLLITLAIALAMSQANAIEYSHVNNVLNISTGSASPVNDLFLNGNKIKLNGSLICQFPGTSEGGHQQRIVKTFRPNGAFTISVDTTNSVCTLIDYFFDSRDLNQAPSSFGMVDTGSRLQFPFSRAGGGINNLDSVQYRVNPDVISDKIDGTSLFYDNNILVEQCTIFTGTAQWAQWLDMISDFEVSAVVDYNKSNCNVNLIIDTSKQ